jgi:hypothetical protein
MTTGMPPDKGVHVHADMRSSFCGLDLERLGKQCSG